MNKFLKRNAKESLPDKSSWNHKILVFLEREAEEPAHGGEWQQLNPSSQWLTDTASL